MNARLAAPLLLLAASLAFQGCLNYKKLTYTLLVHPDMSGTLTIEGAGIHSNASDPEKARKEVAEFYAGDFSETVANFATQFGLNDPTGELSHCEATGCDGKAEGTFGDILKVLVGFAEENPCRFDRTPESFSVSFELEPSSDSTEDCFVLRSEAEILEHNAHTTDSITVDGKTIPQYTWKLDSSKPTTVSFKIKVSKHEDS